MKNRLYFDVSRNDTATKKELFEKIKDEKNAIGYYNLPDQDISSLLAYAASFDNDIEYIVVLGIGGSSLGAKAIYEFLKPRNGNKRKLVFFESTDPVSISYITAQIDISKSHFLVISKSGTTIETIAVFKYIYSLQSDPGYYTFITDKDSPLEKFARGINAKVFHIPSNVGGRFSALSAVGLLPLALCGIDIKALLDGAGQIKESFFHDGYIRDILLDKALFYAKHHTVYHINCIFAYSETLKYFCEWYVQLWGESLGKKQRHSSFNVGLTPVGLIGPKDQHSFLQLLMEGTRDKSATFIKIEDFKDPLIISNISLQHLESLDVINNIEFHKLINMQCDATFEALKMQEGIPLDEISIQAVDEHSIGELVYYYELLTSLVGRLIDVDTYNQPSVELGKTILKDKLEKSKAYSLSFNKQLK
ncbi:MAG: glucose-6-phosphate isomerase [Sulfurovaceae bacterium]|nr:glucose-6-phosphate isomerase [Sulfurovaceae bacterium]